MLWVILLSVPGTSSGDGQTIHRCTMEDGTVAFQELPCTEQQLSAEEHVPDKPDQADAVDDFFGFENPFDAPTQAPSQPVLTNSEPPSQDRVACEKTARLSIDVIDAKLNESKSEDDRETYLAELLELTAQLRACKQL